MATAEAQEIIRKVATNDKDQTSVELTHQHNLDTAAITRLLTGLFSNVFVNILSLQNVGLQESHFSHLALVVKNNGHLSELYVVDASLTDNAIEKILSAIDSKGSVSKVKLFNPATPILTEKGERAFAGYFDTRKMVGLFRRFCTSCYGVEAER